MSEAIAVGFGIEDFIFLLHGAVMTRRHGLRRRKKRPGWSNGAVSSKRPLLVVGTSTARCQFVELKLVVDSRTKSAYGSGQEKVRPGLVRATPRGMPAEAQAVNH